MSERCERTNERKSQWAMARYSPRLSHDRATDLPQGASSFRRNDGVLQGDDVQEAAVEGGNLAKAVVVIFDEPIDDPTRQAEEVVHHFVRVVLGR